MRSGAAVIACRSRGIQPAWRAEALVKAPYAAAISLLVAILAGPVLVFLGAFSLRLLVGVEAYRDSGAWVGVVGGAALAAVAVGALAYRGLVTKG